MRAELAQMRERAAEMEQRMADEVERVRRSLGAEIVPYGAYETAEICLLTAATSVRIRVERPPTQGVQSS